MHYCRQLCTLAFTHVPSPLSFAPQAVRRAWDRIWSLVPFWIRADPPPLGASNIGPAISCSAAFLVFARPSSQTPAIHPRSSEAVLPSLRRPRPPCRHRPPFLSPPPLTTRPYGFSSSTAIPSIRRWLHSLSHRVFRLIQGCCRGTRT